MILVYHGILPYEHSRHRGLMEAYARHEALVYVDPNTTRRPTPSQQSAYEAALTGVGTATTTRRVFPVTLRAPLPGGRIRLIARVNRWLALRAFVGTLQRISTEPIVVVSQHPGLLPTARGLGADLTVYEIRDDVAGFALTPRAARRDARDHRRMLRQNDIVWAISKALVADIATTRPDAHETGVGVEYTDFAQAVEADAPRGMRQIARPRIGLVGNLNDRVDWPLLERIAHSRPSWQLVLVGPLYHSSEAAEVALEELIRLENVHHIPPVAQEEIPGCIAALDVCLIPYRLTPATTRINSLKAYQYLASGKPVVSSKIPSVEELGDVVHCADRDDFVAAIERALADDSPGAVAQRRERARAFDWSKIADHQRDILQKHLAGQRGSAK